MRLKHTKKIMAAAAVLLLLVLPVQAADAGSTQMTGKVSGSTYTVVIPTKAVTPVAFLADSSSVGSLEVRELKLAPGQKVMASAQDGIMTNSADPSSSLAYTAGFAARNGGPMVNPVELAEGASHEILVQISREAWDKAPAGDYSGTIEIELSVVDD